MKTKRAGPYKHTMGMHLPSYFMHICLHLDNRAIELFTLMKFKQIIGLKCEMKEEKKNHTRKNGFNQTNEFLKYYKLNVIVA